MAAMDVTISGVLFDKTGRTSQPVVLIGEATLTGLGVGGGPMPPGQGGQPPGIWGPTDPRPGWGLPQPPGRPPGIWGGPIDPYPGHPLPGQPPGIWGPTDPRPGVGPIIPPGPPDGGQPPVDTVPGGDKPPPAGQAGWGYVAEWSDGTPGGWGFFPAESDKPQPPSQPAATHPQHPQPPKK